MSTQLVYKIAKWSETYETSESRRYKTLTWVSMPVGFDSNGYQLLIEHHPDDSAAMYGAWCALVSIAAKCGNRGVLANSKGEPLTPERCARLAYMQPEPFRKLFAWASSEDVRWLEVTDLTQQTLNNDPTATQQSPNNRTGVKQSSNGRQTATVELPNLTKPNLTKPKDKSSCRSLAASDVEEPPKAKKVKATEEDRLTAIAIMQGVQKVTPRSKSFRGSKVEATTDRWSEEVRLIREQDKRTHDEIKDLFEWANRDAFWRANILSPKKLREKWDQLEAKRASNGSKTNDNTCRGRASGERSL